MGELEFSSIPQLHSSIFIASIFFFFLERSHPMRSGTVHLSYQISPQALVTRGIKVLLMTADDGKELKRGHLKHGTFFFTPFPVLVKSETEQESFCCLIFPIPWMRTHSFQGKAVGLS